MVTPDILKKD